MTELSILALIVAAVVFGLDFYYRYRLRTILSGKEQSQKSADPCERSCNLVPIDAQQFVHPAVGAQQTVLLYRCSGCGQHSTSVFLGAWALADFLKTKSEIQELKDMVAR